jgi:hypothetical protein
MKTGLICQYRVGAKIIQFSQKEDNYGTYVLSGLDTTLVGGNLRGHS